MKTTFNQLCAAGLILISLGCLMYMYSHPTNNEFSVEIGAIIGSGFSTGIMFLLKASSDAKHADEIKDMTEKLSNSIPKDQKTNI